MSLIKKRKIITKKKRDVQLETCAICFETSTNPLKCGHCFHKECLEKWLKYNSCPVCRKPIDEKKAVRKCEYDSDVSNDEYEALRVLQDMLNREEHAIFDPFDVLLQSLPRYFNRNDSFGPYRRNDTNTISVTLDCRTCQTHLNVDDPAFTCEACGEGFFCNDTCKSRHVCLRQLPPLVCADCDRVVSQCVCGMPELEEDEECGDCGLMDCVCTDQSPDEELD
jgi:hypothetical protein